MVKMAATNLNNLLFEFLAGGIGNQILTEYQSVSPLNIDKITAKYGASVYDRMLTDDDVSSALETRKLSVTADGIRVQPAKDADPKNPDDIRNIYADFVSRCIEGMDTDELNVAYEMLNALAYGNKIAEVVYRYGEGEDSSRLVLKGIYPKPNDSYDYIIDTFGHLVGVAPIGLIKHLNEARELQSDEIGDAMFWSAVIPKVKILQFTNDSKNGGIQGTSVLAAAYTPWFIKTQVLPEFFRYIKQFASPSVVGTLPPGSDIEAFRREDGTFDIEKKDEELLNALIQWVNAYALVVPNGTEIDVIKSEGNGEAFRHATEYFGRQITKVILGTAQTTNEAQHESRSSKNVAQDVVGLRVANDRRKMAVPFTELSRTLIKLNFGPQNVKYAPSIFFSALEQQDRFAAMESYSNAYSRGFIQDDQLLEIYDELGLPELEPGYFEEKRLRSEQAMQERARVFNPAA